MKLRIILGVAVLFFVGIHFSHAETITLTDSGSTAIIDPVSSQGMYDWFVDGQDQLKKQWFWYRVGSTDPERSIDALSLTSKTQYADNIVDTRYAENRFTAKILYMLTGTDPGNGVSDIAETISIKNTSTSTLNFHFFQYVDIDLLGTPFDYSAEIQNTATSSTAMQSDGIAAVAESNTTETPKPSRYQVGGAAAILGLLNNAVADDLNNTAGPVYGRDVPDGDLAWAFQWDVTLAPNQTYVISKDKHLDVPEPGICLLLASGGLMLWVMSRRRRG
jgi:hypothetical protein